MKPKHYHDIDQIKKRLAPEVEQLIRQLYPEAEKEGSSFRIGNLQGEKGRSLKISLSPTSPGDFFDHSTGESGSVIKLVACAKNIGVRQAIDFLASYTRTEPVRALETISKEVDSEKLARQLKPLSEANIQQIEETRKISTGTLEAYDVGKGSNREFAFPHYISNTDKIGLLKHWSMDEKKIWTNTDPIHSLFGKPVCEPDRIGTEQIVITEGQWDAMSLYEIGIPAVSVPSGTNNSEWIAEDYDFLNLFEKIVLVFDSDEPGQKAARDAAFRLGEHRCCIVDLPLKDPNEMLVAGRVDELRAAVETSIKQPLTEIVDPTKIEAQTMAFCRGENEKQGIPFFIPEFDLHFRYHEMTLFFAPTSMGKALCLETDIPTPTGIKKMRDIKAGDLVFNEDGKPVRVEAETEVWTGTDCWEVEFDDRTKVVCSGNHLWVTETALQRASASRQRAQVASRTKANYDQRSKITAPQIKNTRELAATIKTNGRSNHSIKIAKAYDSNTPAKMSPYTLGVWLGDGTSKSSHISKSDADIEIIENIRDAGWIVEKKKSKFRWLVKGLQTTLKEIGVYDNKMVPEWCFSMTPENRLSLLQGLMDTDGSIDSNRRCEFSSTNIQLAKSAQRLAASLGIKAFFAEGEAYLDGRYIGKKYRVSFKTNLNVFRLKRKLDRLDENEAPQSVRRFIKSVTPVKSVPTKCIQVEGGMFLCTTSCIATHNSTVVQNQIAYLASIGEKVFVASFEQPAPNTLGAILMAQHSRANLPFEEEQFQAAYRDLTKDVFLYKSRRKTNPNHLIKTFEHAHRQHGISHFVVDNIMTLNVDRQDNTAQAGTADLFREFVANFPVHLYVVAHPRKPAEEPKGPLSLYEIQGASEWGNMPDNIISIYRNVEKHTNLEQMRNDGVSDKEIRSNWAASPDGEIVCRKQRLNGRLPSTPIYFHAEVKRITRTAAMPMPFKK